MLQAIRGKAGSWIVKILFVFLILSFGAWGVGDIFQNGGVEETAAEVGGVKISVAAVDQTLRQNVEQMRQLFGPEFDIQQAVQLGLVDRALDTLVTGALLDRTAADLGVMPPDDLVAEEIRARPAFQDQSGRFSRDLFLNLLARNGLTEQGFVDQLRRDMARERVIRAVATGAAAPGELARSLYRYRHEMRVADTITLAIDSAADVPAPTEEQIESFHQSHGDMFSAPEYRTLTLVTLRAEDLADEIAVGEDALREEYEGRRDSYHSPETRSFDQVVVPEKATADEIAAAVRNGKTLAEAAAGTDTTVIPLDWAGREAMLPQLADAGFSLPEGGVSDPVQTPFGWHVLAVTGIRPEGTRTFEDVRGELEAELKLDKAQDRMFETANELEDALAGGASLEDAANQLGLPTVEVPAIARDGVTRSGEAAPDLPSRDAVLETAFSLAESEASTLEDTPDGLYYVVRVNDVIEPTVEPLDEVRDEVVAAWTHQQRVEAVEALANTVSERLKNGEDPQAVANATGASYARTPALLRDGSNRGSVPPALVGRVFDMTVRDVAVVPDGDGQIVARLAEVTAADPAQAGDALVKLQDEVERQVAQDLVAQFTQALRGQYGVTINRSALEQIYRSS